MGGHHGSVLCILSLFVVFISCLSLGVDFSELVCRGRCSAAELNTDLENESCISRCCVHSPGDTANNTLPVDCPLFGYNSCSTPDTPSESPDLSIENGTVLLPFNTDVLDKGIPLSLTEQSSGVSSNGTQVILVKSVHLSSQVVNYQLFYAGARNELDLKVTECYNVSLAVINECGMSDYSAIASFIPTHPNPPSNLAIVSTELKDKSPNVTVSWQYEGPVDAIVNISLVVDAQNPSYGCDNVWKTVNGSQNAVSFMPEDFSNNSVWLCFYDVAVLVSYVLPCQFDSQVQTQAAHLQSRPILLEEPVKINLTEAELIWNSSSLAYSLKLSWTVPETYNLPNSLLLFKILFFKDRSSKSVKVPATAGKLKYEVVVLKDKLEPQADGYMFMFIPIVNPSIPNYNYRPPPVMTDKLEANGEPPSSVLNVTVTEKDRNTLQINWQEPDITNGNITGYVVTVTVYGEYGNFSQVNTTIHNNSHVLDMTILQETSTNISISVTAVNTFGTGSPSARIIYTIGESTDVDGRGILTTVPSNVGGIVAGVVVPLVILGIALVFIVTIIFFWHLRRTRLQLTKYSDLHPSSLETILNPKEDNYKLYFKRLPPAMVDRWIIPLHMFNSESFHLLGEGNFSSVYFSLVHGPLSTPTKLDQFKNYSEESVAVKLLKGNASEVEMEAFLNEAEILKTLSTQNCPYVVHLVGLQLEHAPPMIAMELVPCGNLLDILKSSSLADEGEPDSDMIAMISPMHPQNMLRRQSQRTLVEFQRDRAKSIDSYIHLRSYSLPRNSLSLPFEIAIKPSQLLKFAIQVNRGMDYLQSFGVLHRDLACRNLLLSASGIVKISDFGFACFLDGNTEVVAELPTDSKPLRWMAPEAFEDNLFSEASDVWSFGVTLWELFSQGKFPYPTSSDSDVLAAVKAGNYLECPEKCDEKVYNLMLSCWKLSRKDRPQFSVLKKTLEGFMYDLYPYIQPE